MNKILPFILGTHILIRKAVRWTTYRQHERSFNSEHARHSAHMQCLEIQVLTPITENPRLKESFDNTYSTNILVSLFWYTGDWRHVNRLLCDADKFRLHCVLSIFIHIQFLDLSVPSNHFKLHCYSDTHCKMKLLDHKMSLKIETSCYDTNVLLSSLKILLFLIYISHVYSFNNQL